MMLMSMLHAYIYVIMPVPVLRTHHVCLCGTHWYRLIESSDVDLAIQHACSVDVLHRAQECGDDAVAVGCGVGGVFRC